MSCTSDHYFHDFAMFCEFKTFQSHFHEFIRFKEFMQHRRHYHEYMEYQKFMQRTPSNYRNYRDYSQGYQNYMRGENTESKRGEGWERTWPAGARSPTPLGYNKGENHTHDGEHNRHDSYGNKSEHRSHDDEHNRHDRECEDKGEHHSHDDEHDRHGAHEQRAGEKERREEAEGEGEGEKQKEETTKEETTKEGVRHLSPWVAPRCSKEPGLWVDWARIGVPQPYGRCVRGCCPQFENG